MTETKEIYDPYKMEFGDVIYVEPKFAYFKYIRKFITPVFKLGFLDHFVEANRKEEVKHDEKENIRPEERQKSPSKIFGRFIQKKEKRLQKADKPVPEKKKAKEVLSFYDVKTRKKFETDKYDIVERNKRYIAMAVNSHGKMVSRFVKKPDNIK